MHGFGFVRGDPCTQERGLGARLLRRDDGAQGSQRGFATAEAYGDKRFPGRVTQIVGELGRKTQRLDDPLARVDTRVLELVFTLDDAGTALPLGLRMDVALE